MMNSSDAQRYARVAGILFLVSIVAGGFGESYVPGKLLAASGVAETAGRMASHVGLFRASFAAYLVEASCDLALTGILYVLLRPVSRPLAFIAACFGIFSTAIFAAGEVLYFAAALPVIDADVAKALTPDARAAFTYLCLILYGYVFAIFTALYGIPLVLHGYLILRSGYLPRALGAIVILGGASFIVKNFFAVLLPQYDSMLYALPLMLALLSMGLWFLGKGINRPRWEQRQQEQQGV